MSEEKSNGEKMIKQPLGKCFAAIFVKAKGCFCTRLRNNCRRFWKVAVYVRNEGELDDDDVSKESDTIVTVTPAKKADKGTGKQFVRFGSILFVF